MDGGTHIKNENLKKHHYIEGYAKCLENKSVEWDKGRNVEQIWKQVK